jgi:molybdate transport system substrate-binding protein
MYRPHLLSAVLAAAALAAGHSDAAAADLQILSGGAAKSGLSVVIPDFEKTTGNKTSADYQPMGKLMATLEGGATPDIVVITTDVLETAVAKGFVKRETATEVGRVKIGVAVKSGAPVPDISTADAFKAMLLKASSVIIINPKTGTSGRHLAQVFKDLGIAEALEPKLKTMDGGFVAERVATGEVEVALHQMSELIPVNGITIVGPIPAALQKETTYVALVGAKAKQPDAAAAFLKAVAAPQTRAAVAKKGYESN